MRVLVTGGTSMLGRATVRLLLDRGDEVTVLQRGPSGLACRELRGDIADSAVVDTAVAGQDAVLHLAAKVDVTGRWRDYARANIDGTDNVLAACRRRDVPRLVHVSSPSVAHAGSALVGVGAGTADPERARGSYSRSKAVAELHALAADSPTLAVLVVRPHLVWGPGDTQLVGRIVARARAGRLPIVGSGAALIDTTYVDNAATALVAALDVCGPEHGEPVVVSNGEPRQVQEMLVGLCLAAGAAPPTRRVPVRVAWLAGAAAEAGWALARRSDTPPLTRFLAEQLGTAHWFDQRRTRQLLRWRPEVGLDEGFARLARWYAAADASRTTGRSVP